MQEIIPLIATKIEFTRHCLVYTVSPKIDKPQTLLGSVFPFYCDKSIVDKDLIPKSSLLCYGAKSSFPYNDWVYFKSHNVTPQFYEAILKKVLPDFNEYENELSAIYLVGDVVGYIIK